MSGARASKTFGHSLAFHQTALLPQRNGEQIRRELVGRGNGQDAPGLVLRLHPFHQVDVGARLRVEREDILRVHRQSLVRCLKGLRLLFQIHQNPGAQRQKIAAIGVKGDGSIDALQRLLRVPVPIAVAKGQFVVPLGIVRLVADRALQKVFCLGVTLLRAQERATLQLGAKSGSRLVAHFLIPRKERTSL